MSDSDGLLIDRAVLPQIRARVDAAFAGFIGNEEAVHAITRSLVYAIANTSAGETVSMAEAFLLSGPPSTGKTDLARRIMTVLVLPFVYVDGRNVRSPERLFDMIDQALLAATPPLAATPGGGRGGVPVLVYPAFIAFVDEIHLASEGVQQSLLPLLEADDRRLLLDSGGFRRVADVRKACFVFATTRPADLDRPFRSRLTEIPLRRYTVEEVALMVRARFSMLPFQYLDLIARCSRLTPRIAFSIARDVLKEVYLSDDAVIGPCVNRVLEDRGVVCSNGCTRDDVRYLRALRKERRPLGERALRSLLPDVDPARITEDIEPYLFTLGLAVAGQKGREITSDGIWFLKDVADNGVK